ncbi:MAG: carbohydrate-binding domain-containing protein [Coprobacillus sp.]|nr:carbohydrate-binding domain-containing protein [Coprobacillus sp.]
MKGKKILLSLACVLLLTGCKDASSDDEIPESLLDSDTEEDYNWDNPGDVLGGGQDATEIPESIEKNIEPLESAVSSNNVQISDLETSSVPTDATKITGSTNINKDNYGNYYIEGEITLTSDGTIRTNDNLNGDVTIYLAGCTIYNNDSGKDADHAFKIQRDTTLVLVDGTENKIIMGSDNTDNNAINASKGASLTILGNGSLEIESYKRGIDVDGDLIISGNPTIKITSTNDCIRAGDELIGGQIYLNGGSYTLKSTDGNGLDGSYITILNGANLDITTADSDAIKAEIAFTDDDGYLVEDDGKAVTPEFSYDDGYVYIGSAGDVKITTTGQGDGIQADTFVFIKSGNFNIEVNGGAPETVTSRTSNNGEAKAIKAGTIDYDDPNTGKTVELDSIYDYTIAIAGGTFDISSDDDALHSNGQLYIYGGSLSIATGDDAIHAETDLVIEEGCAIGIDRCYEGIEAQAIQINGGYVSLYAVDDGINAASTTGRSSDRNCQIVINGGEIYVNAEGDGIDSNGGITINGGTIYVNGPSTGADAALDSEYGITVNGGNLIAIGALGMVETPSTSSSQYVISYATSSKQSAGTLISVLDKDDNVIISIESVRQFQSIIVSSPDFVKGETYTFYGGTTKLGSVTISSTITTGGSTQSGNGNGRPGGSGGPGGH